ncbi:N-acetyltransferase [Sesbania bispinosa]|nr:N-acetyltransferase [Sesbania bispinosa]
MQAARAMVVTWQTMVQVARVGGGHDRLTMQPRRINGGHCCFVHRDDFSVPFSYFFFLLLWLEGRSMVVGGV